MHTNSYYCNDKRDGSLSINHACIMCQCIRIFNGWISFNGVQPLIDPWLVAIIKLNESGDWMNNESNIFGNSHVDSLELCGCVVSGKLMGVKME